MKTYAFLQAQLFSDYIDIQHSLRSEALLNYKKDTWGKKGNNHDKRTCRQSKAARLPKVVPKYEPMNCGSASNLCFLKNEAE